MEGNYLKGVSEYSVSTARKIGGIAGGVYHAVPRLATEASSSRLKTAREPKLLGAGAVALLAASPVIAAVRRRRASSAEEAVLPAVSASDTATTATRDGTVTRPGYPSDAVENLLEHPERIPMSPEAGTGTELE